MRGIGQERSKVEQLKELIASYWQIPEEAIDWETVFQSRQLRQYSSLRMLRFLASVEEQCHVTIDDPDAIKGFRDLLNLVDPPCAS